MPPRFGVECTQVDQTLVEAFAAARRPDTRLVLVETPSNPLLQITDLRAVSALAHDAGGVDGGRQPPRYPSFSWL
jgi:methionine-gamma-lyase